MAKIKVPIFGTTGKSVALNPLATVGAQIGVDLLMPDGSIATLAALTAAVDSSSSSSSGSSSGTTAHRLLSGLTLGDDHPQYALRSILTTRGDIYVEGASGLARLAVGTNHQVLMSNGTDPGWVTLFANPSASVGLTAVNGTASTAMRSDGAPALDQAIVPSWTGQHTFSLTPLVGAVKVVLESRQVIAGSGLTGGGALTGDVTLTLDHGVFAAVAFSGAYSDLTGRPADLTALTFLTTANETGTVPNSRQVLAGTNVAFDDTTPGQRTINVTGGGSGTVTSVDITPPAAGITASGGPITTSGAITLALADDLAALEGLAGSGMAARTGTSTWALRTLTGTASRVSVTNGSGAAGNPTFDIDAAYVGQSSITTLGTITTGVWNGTTVTVDHGGTGAATLTGYVKGAGTSALTASSTIPYADISGTPTGAALTKADDTNVTLSLGGSPTTALLNAASLTLGWTGTLAVARGGTGAGTLTGYLKGNGTSAVTASATIPASDIASGAALTKADDTNVTLSLGGTPATALLVAASLTLGWTGTLAVARGGTGAATLTGYMKGNGTSAVTAAATVPTTDLAGTLAAAQFPALTGDVTTVAGALAATIAAAAVTYAKIQNVSATSRILGRITAGAGTIEELTAANVKTILALATTDLSDVSSGTYTGTLTGCTTSPTITVRWVRVGNLVTITIPAVSATSNTTAASITGSLPAAIQPAIAQTCQFGIILNAGSANLTGPFARVDPASSTITLGFGGSSTAFTNSGTKGISSNSTFTYQLT